MAVADTKKVQTMINTVGQQIQIVRGALETIKSVRVTFQAANPDITGTPLEGNLTAVNQAINDLDTTINTGVNDTVWDSMEAAIVPTHRNAALD